MYSLKVTEVSKSYGSFQALKNVSFSVEPGDFLGLLGLNGAGKTTLISAIAGLRKFSGKIEIMGLDITKNIREVRTQLGIVPQELTLDFFTVYQVLKFQAGIYGVKTGVRERIYELLERLHLTSKVNAKVSQLSGGMKRRLMIAMALIHSPKVLILDEPTAGVDVQVRKALWEFIQEINKAGTTVILTTHYLEEVEQLCKNIVLLRSGEVLAAGKLDKVMSSFKIQDSVTLELKAEDLFKLQPLMLLYPNWQLEEHSLTFDLPEANYLNVVLKLLEVNQVGVKRVHVEPVSLEKIFMNLSNPNSVLE